MATLDVKIPSMGESITGGVLAQWHVKDGDFVKKDQPLYELETDKITSEGTAETAGRIALKAAAGSDVTIGQVVATIEVGASGPSEPAAASSAPVPQPKTQNSRPETPVSPAVRRLGSELGVDPAAVPGTGKGGRVTKGDLLAATQPARKSEDGGQPSVQSKPDVPATGASPGSGSPPAGAPPAAPARPAARSARPGAG
jgi:2-oxoglutarate dehydrogenase E2 component (dihydrolipoamide succinyltransferase)